jgi:hypothetical protein
LAHGLSDGNINKKYSSIPALQAIGSDRIKITAAASTHIVNLFIKKLYDEDILDTAKDFDEISSRNLLTEIRSAIPKGIVISVSSADDLHNPLDKQLEIYTYLDMSKIISNQTGYAKMKILCRLSVHTSTISVRTIQKNFDIGT